MNPVTPPFNETAFLAFRDSLSLFYKTYQPGSSAPQTYEQFCQRFQPTSKVNLRFSPSDFQNQLRHQRYRIIPSAGSSSKHPTFRLEQSAPDESFSKFLSYMQNLLGFSPEHTLIINGYPAAINLGETLTTFEASSRPDLIEGFLHDYHEHFQKIIIIGQPLLFLYLNRWSEILPSIINKCCFVVGGQCLLPEQVEFIRNHQKHSSLPIVHLYGLAEIGLGIAIEENLGKGYQCSPTKYFLEISSESELLVTSLDLKRPVFRYETGDLAKWNEHGRIEILGRKKDSKWISQFAKLNKLFANQNLAAKLSGRFFFSDQLNIEAWEPLSSAEIEEIPAQVHYTKADPFSSLNWPQVDLLRKTGVHNGQT